MDHYQDVENLHTLAAAGQPSLRTVSIPLARYSGLSFSKVS